MPTDDLAARMRRGEAFHGLRIPPGCYAVLRVDGRGFSRFTAAHFEKPFDRRFHELMTATARRLVEELHGRYAYTESDEISVFLPRDWDLFDREVEKAVSLSAGVASAEFTLLGGRAAHFDSRAWVSGRRDDVVDYFRWRQADAARCALNGWAYWTLRQEGLGVRQATARLHGATRAEKHELLFQRGVQFQDLPAWQRRGTGIYWERYTKEARNPRTGEPVLAERRRLRVDEDLPMKDDYAEFLRGLLFPGGTLRGVAD